MSFSQKRRIWASHNLTNSNADFEQEQLTTACMQTTQQLFSQSQKAAYEATNKKLTPEQLKQHLYQYINIQIQNTNQNKKRRRSYQLLQIQQQSIEKTRSRSDSSSRECALLDEKMQCLEEMFRQVLKNITDVMLSRKLYKIRQSFRKLVLRLMKIENLFIYCCILRDVWSFMISKITTLQALMSKAQIQTYCGWNKDGCSPQRFRILESFSFFILKISSNSTFRTFLMMFAMVTKFTTIHSTTLFMESMLCIHAILSQAVKFKQILSPFKLFSVVFSGICNDVVHTGFTNLFEITRQSKIVTKYNDSSPLSNFHAAYTFQPLKKPENNFLKFLSAEDMKQFRKSVISNILFTDIKQNFPLLKKFNGLIKDQMPKNDQYVNILSQMIVHTADFGGSTKEFQICKAQYLKINLEFSNQYKMQGQLYLEQTPFMKDLNNISILSKNEGGFLKIIVLPLYEAMDQNVEIIQK